MTKKLTTNEFIEKSTKTHGGYYDYSNSNYIGAKKPITIIMPMANTRFSSIRITLINAVLGNREP